MALALDDRPQLAGGFAPMLAGRAGSRIEPTPLEGSPK